VRLDRLIVQGMGPLGHVELDLDDVPGPLVGVCGDNGSGKTTLLELAGPGALYRSCPTRGSLAQLATRRDAVLEATWTYGATYTIRHLVDAVSGKAEAVVVDEGGGPLLSSTKLREFDAWAAAHLPPAEVLQSAMFAVQGARGFLGMRPAARKAVLLRALGIEHLELLAERARARGRSTGEELAVVRARLSDLDEPASVEDLDAELAAARQAAVGADERLAAAREALEQARATAAATERMRADAEQRVARRSELAERLARATAAVEDLERREAATRAVLAREDVLRLLEEERDALRADLDAVQATGAEQRTAHELAKADLARASEAAAAANGAADEAGARVEDLERRVAAGEQVREAGYLLGPARYDAELAEEQLRGARAELEALHRVQLRGARDRVDALRDGLVDVTEAETVQDARATGRRVLEEDDGRAQLAEQAPGRAAELESQIEELASGLRDAQGKLGRLEQLAARRVDLETAQAELDRARVAVDEAAAGELDAARVLQQARAAAADAGDALQTSVAQHRVLREQERQRFATLDRDLTALGGARARLEEIEPQLRDARERRAAADEALAAAPLPETPPAIGTLVSDAAAAADAEERSTRVAHAAVTTLEQRLQRAQLLAARRTELHASDVRLERRQAVWTRLGNDLGRDGLQALEIDAAGPELTASINDLLHQCVSTRWTVSIETTRRSADGKRQLEGLEVRVLDTVAGREAGAETYSGGECVLLGEAVSLALTQLACRRGDLEGLTLIRDESGAALSPDNARRYVAMLRRAAAHIGAERVLLVSHSPEVLELCDSRLRVAGGAVEVEA